MFMFSLDATLAIVAALASFALGILVWVRRPAAVGNALFGMVAACMGIWSAAGWVLGTATEGTVWRSLWEVLFYLSVFLTPAMAAHAVAYLGKKHEQRTVWLIYLASMASCAAFVFSFSLSLAPSQVELAERFFAVATGASLITYAGAILFTAVELYPSTMGTAVLALERRRAAYGILILIIYLMSGGLQIATGIAPSTFTQPLFAALFLGLSLLAFMRVSFLDVDIDPLEAFFLPLFAFFLVSYLRAPGANEAVLAVISAVSISIFGVAAMRSVRGEQDKLRVLEEANRQLRLIEEARKDFMDMVAHQLRTPLGGIRASASMMANGDYGELSTQAKKAAELMQDAATRLLSLSDTFLNASRVEVGVYETRREVSDLRAEALNVVNELTLFATSKGLTLEHAIDPAFERVVRVDREVFRNALFNLVDNAIKYTKVGRVRISCAPQNGGMVGCSVSDTGRGLSGADMGQLFQKFNRGQGTEADGVGLGLYVVKRLVDAAGGSISAASPGPGKGSVFSFQLPFEDVDGA